jgi:hypothetical protein
MTKPGLARPVVIPKKKDLSEDIVLSVGRTLGLTRKEIEQRLNPKKRSRSVLVLKGAFSHNSGRRRRRRQEPRQITRQMAASHI